MTDLGLYIVGGFHFEDRSLYGSTKFYSFDDVKSGAWYFIEQVRKTMDRPQAKQIKQEVKKRLRIFIDWENRKENSIEQERIYSEHLTAYLTDLEYDPKSISKIIKHIFFDLRARNKNIEHTPSFIKYIRNQALMYGGLRHLFP
jgi:hypothetical protein